MIEPQNEIDAIIQELAEQNHCEAHPCQNPNVYYLTQGEEEPFGEILVDGDKLHIGLIDEQISVTLADPEFLEKAKGAIEEQRQWIRGGVNVGDLLNQPENKLTNSERRIVRAARDRKEPGK